MFVNNFNFLNRVPKIIVYPDPILLLKADMVKDIDEKINKIFKQMVNAMEIKHEKIAL